MKKNTFWIIHVPRTGGLSVIQFFAKIIKNKDPKNKDPNLHLINEGHKKFNLDYKMKVENNHKFKIHMFTILRDPVKHTISVYSYMRYTQHEMNNFTKSCSLDQWLEKTRINFWGFFGKTVEEATNNLLINIDYILDTQTLKFDLNNMFKELDLNLKFGDIHINKTRKANFTLQDIKLIKEFREKDYVLLDNISKKKKIIIEY